MHGDDFTFFVALNELGSIGEKMEHCNTIERRGLLGSGQGESREIVILGRTAGWTDSGIDNEAVERHAEELMREFRLREDSKPVATQQ